MNQSKGYGRTVGGEVEEKHPRMKEEVLDPLVAGALAGDARAFQQLWLVLDPVIEEIAASGKVTGRLCGRPDERRGVVLRVMEKLLEDGASRLVLLHERLQRRDGSFLPWFRTVVRNLAVSFTRTHPERLGVASGFAWAEHEEPPPNLAGGGPDVLAGVAAHELLAFAERELDPVQLAALRMWMAEHDGEEIAGALGLESAAAAARVVHAAHKRLRDHVARDQGNKIVRGR